MLQISTTVIVCLLLILQVFSTLASPRLTAPGYIRAFRYDVAVHAYNATIGDVVELFLNNQTDAITAQVITKSPQSSTLIFNCGYFFQTGTYFFKIRSETGATLATSEDVVALGRPSVIVEWGKKHDALTTDVKVSFKVKNGICNSDIARLNKMSLRLTKLENATEELFANSSSVATFPVVSTSDTFVPSYFVLPCENFPSAGRYKTELIVTSSNNDDVILATSDVMNVEWSKDYNLQLLKHSFPCTGQGVTVAITFPPCASTKDSIRLLSVSNGTMQVIATEERGENDHVTFSCSAFYNMNVTVDGFCFQYVTEGGHVTRTVCEPVGADSDFEMNGSWSPWTGWSTCERPCQKTMKRKKRICDNPQPFGKGEKCRDSDGQESVEELIAVTSDEPAYCAIEKLTSSMTEQCDCGCSIQTENTGVIVSSTMTNCDRTNTVIWTVSVPSGHVINFKLLDYQLSRDEVLTIRDGRTSWPLTSQFPTVMSQSNIVIIQWVQSGEKNNLRSCGFILAFEAVVKPTSTDIYETTSEADEDIAKWIERTIADNPVVLGGIGACVIIIAIVVIVVVIHCRKRKSKKTTLPPGLRTPMNTRLSMPPDGRSCSNADDTESEPMVRPRPIGNAGNNELLEDSCIPAQPVVSSTTAYYLAQRQLELMRRLGKDEHSQMYATGHLTENALRDQEDLLFGDRKSLHKNEELLVT